MQVGETMGDVSYERVGNIRAKSGYKQLITVTDLHQCLLLLVLFLTIRYIN